MPQGESLLVTLSSRPCHLLQMAAYFQLCFPGHTHWTVKLGRGWGAAAWRALPYVPATILTVSCLSELSPRRLQPGTFAHAFFWNSPGKNIGVGSHSLLQQIFPTQGSNPGLLHCRWIFFYQLNHKESPRILEWVAYPFSRRSS